MLRWYGVAMPNGASHLLQSNEELERQLDDLLGELKELCAGIIETIRDNLSEIETEGQQIGNTNEQERQVNSSTMLFTWLFRLLPKYSSKIHTL